MTTYNEIKQLKPCPFSIGDKVQIISPMFKKEWEASECYIVGINLKGDALDRYDFTIKEVGVSGLSDGWDIHDLKCISRMPSEQDRQLQVMREKVRLAALWFVINSESEDTGHPSKEDLKRMADAMKQALAETMDKEAV